MAFSFVAIAAAVANTFLSVVLVLLNKRLITTYHFSFMTVLSGLHFATSFLFCLVLIVIGTLKHKPVNSYWSVFRISVVRKFIKLQFLQLLMIGVFASNSGFTAVGGFHELLLVAQLHWILPSSEVELHTIHNLL